MTTLTTILTTFLCITTVSALGLVLRSIIERLTKTTRLEDPFRPAAWPEAFILGALAYTYVELLLSIAGIRTAAWHLIVLALLATGASIYLQQAYPVPPTKITTKSHNSLWIENSFLGAMAALLFASYLLAAAFPQFDIDMVAHILMKGKILTDSTYHHSIFLRDPVFANVHANYPPLTVFIINLLMFFTTQDVSGFLLMNYLTLLAIALVLNDILARRVPLCLRAAWIFIFISTPEFLSSQFLISSSDILLALTILLSVRYLIEMETDNSLHPRVMFALMISASLLAKNDALVTAAIASLLFVLRTRAAAKFPVLIVITMVAPWMIYRTSIPDPVSGGESALRGLTFAKIMPYMMPTLLTAGDVLLKHWNSLFLVALVSLGILRKDRVALPLAAMILGTVIGYGLMMWVIMPSFSSYRNTFMRVLVHIYPLAILSCAWASARLLGCPSQDQNPEPSPR